MKRTSLFAFAVAALLSVAVMAHSPPSAVDPNVVAAVNFSPSTIGSGVATVVSSNCIIIPRSGGAAGISLAQAHQTSPPNERMLN